MPPHRPTASPHTTTTNLRLPHRHSHPPPHRYHPVPSPTPSSHHLWHTWRCWRQCLGRRGAAWQCGTSDIRQPFTRHHEPGQAASHLSRGAPQDTNTHTHIRPWHHTPHTRNTNMRPVSNNTLAEMTDFIKTPNIHSKTQSSVMLHSPSQCFLLLPKRDVAGGIVQVLHGARSAREGCANLASSCLADGYCHYACPPLVPTTD